MIRINGRSLSVPDSERYIGHVADNEIETRSFLIADQSLFNFEFKLDLQSEGYTDIVTLKKESVDSGILLTWEITSTNLQHNGRLYAQLRAFSSSGEVWHSEITAFSVKASINAPSSFPAVLPSEFEELEQRMSTIAEDVHQSAEIALNSADAAAKSSDAAASLLSSAQESMKEAGVFANSAAESANRAFVSAEITAHPAVIGENGNWYTWDAEQGEYTDSGKKGEGKDGADGYTPQRGVDYFTEEDKEDVKKYVDDTLSKAKESGEFDGANGENGQDGKDGISATHTWNGTVLTITSASGTSSTDLKGDNGKDGVDGKDGVSPTVTFVQNGNGYTMDVVDANGSKSINILNGRDGVDGKDGVNGKDGINGVDGKDGEDGYTPVRGTDYYTEDDKLEMVDLVLQALPNGDEVSY